MPKRVELPKAPSSAKEEPAVPLPEVMEESAEVPKEGKGKEIDFCAVPPPLEPLEAFSVEGGVSEAEPREEAPMEMEGPEFDIPIVLNDRVEYFLRFYQTVARERFARWLKRSGRYIPIMKEVLKEHGLPEDLVYLAMIESGFNPTARSYRQAVGPWQFIYSTAKKYGLRIDYWVDERRDPIKSTVAAAKYLKDLYDMFRCWYLAAAGYNAGEGAVSRAMRRYRTEDYWELIKYPGLKRETKEYVPKMIAAALIAKNPERYGFADIQYDPPLQWDEVTVPPATDLELIARCSGTTVREIRNLNPHLLRWCTPPDVHYTVRIPKGKKEAFLRCFSKIPASKKRYSGFVKYRLKRGDTLWRLSRIFGISVRELKRINRIRNPRRLRAGQIILVPKPSRGFLSLRKTSGGNRKIVHVVRKGENLWRIARSYGVSVEDIKRWNNLKQDLIHPKEKLLIILD